MIGQTSQYDQINEYDTTAYLNNLEESLNSQEKHV